MSRNRNSAGADPGRDQAESLIAGLIARGTSPEPPPALLARVMSGLAPKRPTVWRRARRWLTRPRTLTVTPLRLIPLAAAAATLLAVLVWPRLGPGPASQPVITAAAQADSVELSLHLPEARQVAVIGDFNRWSPKDSEMAFDAERGLWTISLRLPQGRHEYAFLVDGRQVLPDPRAVLSKDDGFGNVNSILVIGNGGNGHGSDQVI